MTASRTYVILGAVVAALGVAAAAARPTANKSKQPQRLIVDTDMGFDVDDAMAVCVANALYRAGQVELLAVVHDTGCPLGIGGVSAMNHFYGHDNVTLGAWKGEFGSDCYTHFNGALGQDQYLSKVINDPSTAGPITNSDQVMLGVQAYRKVLAAAPDSSVNIASIGMPTNIRDLLASGPDQYSPLSGYDLVALKVDKVVFMDGMYNFGCAAGFIGPALDCEGSAQAALKMPPNVSMVFSSKGQNPDIYTGVTLMTHHPWYSPCRTAIENWCCDPNGKSGAEQGRLSWDPITVMIASLGTAAVFEEEVNKGCQVYADEAGHEFFSPGHTRNAQTNFIDTSNPPVAGIEAAIDNILDVVPPKVDPAATDGWVLGGGVNCWPGHGANDIPTTSSTMSIVDCQALCDKTSGCTGVVTSVDGSSFRCWMKSDINFAGCQYGTSFSTWVKGDFVEAAGFNCWTGHGAVDMEDPPNSSCGVMSVHACQQKCLATEGCDGITTSPASGGLINCYRKGDVQLSACQHGTNFNTWKM